MDEFTVDYPGNQEYRYHLKETSLNTPEEIVPLEIQRGGFRQVPKPKRKRNNKKSKDKK